MSVKQKRNGQVFRGEKTIYRLLKIGVCQNGSNESLHRRDLKDLSPDKLQILQDDMKNCVVLIVDEKSMCGQWMLYAVDQRCRQSRPQYSEIPFGNLSVILAGDFTQLPPVGDRALYAT